MPGFAVLNADFALGLLAGVPKLQGAADLLTRLGFKLMVTPVVEESLYWIQCETGLQEAKKATVGSSAKLASLGILAPSLT